MIYVPDTENYSCFVVQNEDVIRAYTSKPRNNATIDYRDYYLHSNYIYKDGQQTFNQYTTLPVCLEESVVTSDYFYRVDIDSILICIFILSIFIIGIPLKIVFRFFRRMHS